MTDSISVQLPVRGRPVTVAGSSGRAMSATGSLIRAGATVTVISPDPTPYLSDLADRGLITIREREFASADIDSAALVFACTGIEAQDMSIAEAAAAHGVFCISDDPADVAPPALRNGHPRSGRVILVGGGPGNPGLLTVAGRDAIAGADVIVTDRLAPVAVLSELAPHAQIIDASKIPGGRRVEQSEINSMLISHALAGKTVIRLKGGDGFVFGRGGEEVDECVRAGIAVDVIPGVSSAIAAPASAMIPATHRGLTQGFTVISGHVPPEHPESGVNYAALAQANTTIILMMAVANLDAITEALMGGGMDSDTPAAVIADGSLPSQREIRATIATIAAAARAADIGPPATTIIGAVAGFVPGHAIRQLQASGAPRVNVG
ncbi:uroporphyrinogen-III C-methyltransferase [Mycolicibacterium komossense]|uniref:uroporphyrinogen-III C-methyltransferase n=1 Tax=Mycolicibacterium komossense TaxID=1779 RepID=A0ABT3CD57_9MYCO|nr:uroporphyrinogen-III C-methyltransferase [Mycolicibacterium komossense]MCV7227376.1 uroporphyrinogen-III C-methyltransferase [Mycolicibacterium komossense]